MIISGIAHHAWARRDDADSRISNCARCGRPIRHYPDVGWVDVTPPVHGGTYDMCPDNDTSGNHVPP